MLAALLVVASYVAAAALFYALWARYWGVPVLMPLPLALAIAAIVGGSILAVCAWRMWQLSEGGPAVAELLGARYVESGRCTPTERRLLNVVEEMAIASGVSVPPVYCLEREEAINALVAGHSPNEAVIVVTRGALTSGSTSTGMSRSEERPPTRSATAPARRFALVALTRNTRQSTSAAVPGRRRSRRCRRPRAAGRRGHRRR